MSTKQVNVRRPKAAKAARELGAALDMDISKAVELALTTVSARLQRHLEAGGHPDGFMTILLNERLGKDEERSGDDG